MFLVYVISSASLCMNNKNIVMLAVKRDNRIITRDKMQQEPRPSEDAALVK